VPIDRPRRERQDLVVSDRRDGNDLDVWTMRPDGGGLRNLTPNSEAEDAASSWPPDGRRISFSSDRDGDFEIYTIRPDGSGVRQLTFNDGPFDGAANWSPDGRLLVFEADCEIYTMRPDGGDQTRLTFNPACDFIPAWVAGRPPDRLHQRPRREPGDLQDAPDGSHQVNLTRHPAFDLGPEWQPLPNHH
jgi:Tol biopolymer transport system component